MRREQSLYDLLGEKSIREIASCSIPWYLKLVGGREYAINWLRSVTQGARTTEGLYNEHDQQWQGASERDRVFRPRFRTYSGLIRSKIEKLEAIVE